MSYAYVFGGQASAKSYIWLILSFFCGGSIPLRVNPARCAGLTLPPPRGHPATPRLVFGQNKVLGFPYCRGGSQRPPSKGRCEHIHREGSARPRLHGVYYGRCRNLRGGFGEGGNFPLKNKGMKLCNHLVLCAKRESSYRMIIM